MSVHDDTSTVWSLRGSEVSSQGLENQPEKPIDLPSELYGKSPYIDSEIISLDVGLAKARYRIHRSILSQCPELAAKPSLKLWGEKTNDTISLPELDAVTAHTLVTYLYTSSYETLDWLGPSENAAVAAYKLSTCVYCAAIRYKVSGLAELAQEKITKLGQDLAIFDVLGVAREHAFPILPENETWFPSYLEGAIKRAVKNDPALFMKPAFVHQIEGDRTFRQVVMTAVVNTYADSTTAAQAQPSVEISTVGDRESRQQPDRRSEALDVPTDLSKPSHRDAKTVDAAGGENVDEIQLPHIEPTALESPAYRPASSLAPESVTDELDYGKSRVYRETLARRSTGDEVLVVESTTKLGRSDSVLEDNEARLGVEARAGKGNEEVEELASPVAEGVEDVEGVGATLGTLKKSRKKRGKKGAGTGFVGVSS